MGMETSIAYKKRKFYCKLYIYFYVNMYVLSCLFLKLLPVIYMNILLITFFIGCHFGNLHIFFGNCDGQTIFRSWERIPWSWSWFIYSNFYHFTVLFLYGLVEGNFFLISWLLLFFFILLLWKLFLNEY